MRARGIDVPIVPGIMPILGAQRSSRASPMPAAPRFRAGSGKRLEGYGDDVASIRAFGLDVVTELCAGLLDAGARGCTSTR